MKEMYNGELIKERRSAANSCLTERVVPRDGRPGLKESDMEDG